MLNSIDRGLPAGGVIGSRAGNADPGPSDDAPQPDAGVRDAAASSARASQVRTVVTRVAAPAALGVGLGVAAGASGQPGAGGGAAQAVVPDVAAFQQSVMDAKGQQLAAQAEYEQAVLAAQEPTVLDAGLPSFDVGGVDCGG